jgi:hypothetical protein
MITGGFKKFSIKDTVVHMSLGVVEVEVQISIRFSNGFIPGSIAIQPNISPG